MGGAPVTPAAYWWNAAALFLLLVRVLQAFLPGAKGLAFSALGAAVLSVIPFFGHAPRYWLAGLTPNVSVPLVALLLAGILGRSGVVVVFRAREWRAAWMVGAVAAFSLYPSGLGLGLPHFDSYTLGWPWLDWRGSFLLFGPVAWAAAFLVWRGNRFGWILAVAAAAFLLSFQESSNFWDYLIDPLYAAVSLVACAVLILRRSVRR
jgi:hypothetical protein